MAKSFIHIYRWAILLAGVLVSACSDELPSNGDTEEETSSEVQFLVKMVGNGSVNVSTRAGEDEVDLSDPRNNFPIGQDFREGISLIRVCSVCRDANSLNFLPDMNNAFRETTNPTGFHEYICQQRVDFGNYSVFNAYKDAIPLKWDVMGDNGQVAEKGNIIRTEAGGGYYMFAAMFPFVYGPSEGSTMENRFVADDQTYKKDVAKDHGYYAANLLINDFRLCHKMFGRDQFRQPIRLDFHHALCMLVVNVEIPLFNALDGTGFSEVQIAAADAMSINNVYCRFKPNYDLTYDRDDCVEVSTSAVTQERESIQMFHSPNFAHPEKTDGFVPEDAFWLQHEDHEGNPSNVVWTQFCVILPPQSFSDTNSYISFNIGDKKYQCSLAGTPAIPLQQTYVTTLTLYIPREESDPVIIGAHLNDWEQYRTPIIPLQ